MPMTQLNPLKRPPAVVDCSAPVSGNVDITPSSTGSAHVIALSGQANANVTVRLMQDGWNTVMSFVNTGGDDISIQCGAGGSPVTLTPTQGNSYVVLQVFSMLVPV